MTPTRTISLIGAALLLALQPAGAETVAIKGGIVHTMSDMGVVKNATVVLRDGVISAVGKNIDVPEGARTIDASGKVVTPGLFDPYSHLGLVEVGAVQGTVDTAISSERYSAAFNVADAINPRSTLIPINRIEGITRTVTAPAVAANYDAPGDGPAWDLIAGQGTAFHLGSTEDYLLRNPVAMFASLGETGAALTGGSRGGAMLKLREVLQDASDFADNRENFLDRDRYEYSVSRLDLEAMVPVVQGELPFVVAADRASDIRAALRLARDFGLELVIRGGAEGWIVADELAQAGVPVILDPLENLPGRFESLGATLQNAAALHSEGVTIAFSTGGSHNARNLKQAAGNAVSHGLPWEAAMKALTINGAEIFGAADGYGRLEPGMDADVVVWDGDPLEVTTFADRVFIQGRDIPMESRQTLLRERYMTPDGERAPAYRHPE